MTAPLATFLLWAITCPAGPTCEALPLRGFATWSACQDARDAVKRDLAAFAVCIRRGSENGEPTE